MRASIKDVAKRAGVSISTVSRVMNKSAPVDKEKTAAVKEAIQHYNYQPNQFGRGLVKQNSQMVGVYIAHTFDSLFDSTYYLELLKGIQTVLDHYNYSMVIINEKDNLKTGNRFVDYVNQKKIDGLIITSSIIPGSEAENSYNDLVKGGYPTVYIGKRFHKEGNNVYAQYEDYMYQMIKEFYMVGHRRVLLFIYEGHKEYIQAVHKKVQKNMPNLKLFLHIQSSNDNPREEFKKQIHNHVYKLGCTAIGCSDMDYIHLIIGNCIELGIRIPEDISIISVEHKKEEGANCFPPINAFYVPAQEMGKIAAKVLITDIEEGNKANVFKELETKYSQRESVTIKKNG
ncbi:MAG TPA: LacI family DNA-binding transcriptional regulator [Candidatus Merdenecus merdavium]|nr:LacI family DNA-binding transcriptional regulator [Candidatus Merdenecus merdavium]